MLKIEIVFDMQLNNAFAIYRCHKKSIADPNAISPRPRHLTVLHRKFVLEMCQSLFMKKEEYIIGELPPVPRRRILNKNKDGFCFPPRFILDNLEK